MLKPRLSNQVRTRIIQLRVSFKGRPLSLDKIRKQLLVEGWNPLPSRGSIQNVIHQWNELPEESRLRGMPFEWSCLGDAELPWESSEWVLKCKREHESLQQLLVPLFQPLPCGPFTNSRAKWCWRVHIAAPELEPLAALAIAEGYSFRDETVAIVLQSQVNVSNKIQNSLYTAENIEQFLNGLLLYKPWFSDQARLEFIDKVDRQVLPWPMEWLGWSCYTYGLGATLPEGYNFYLPSDFPREKLARLPDPVSAICPPTKELSERLFSQF